MARKSALEGRHRPERRSLQHVRPAKRDADARSRLVEAYRRAGFPSPVRAVHGAGIAVPITVEVTGQIWGRDDYEPWPVAERCYRYLNDARQKA